MRWLMFLGLLFSGCAQYNASSSLLGLLLNQTNGSVTGSVASQRRIFLSATTHDGNFGTIAAADSICNNDANRPAATSNYKALLVDAVNRTACSSTNCATSGILENVDWVLQPNTTYYRTNGTTPIFTTNAAAIAIFNLTNSITGTAAVYWTGMRGTPNTWQGSTANRCNFWTDGSAGFQGGTGLGNSVNNSSIRNTSPNCNVLQSLLCVEQP
ncbi:MAG: DUF1554 domain-containing protein [Leptospirales bacterium]|nr:DUF1554 domain-containing protein [Leptospirales bacterium]